MTTTSISLKTSIIQNTFEFETDYSPFIKKVKDAEWLRDNYFKLFIDARNRADKQEDRVIKLGETVGKLNKKLKDNNIK